MPGAPMITSDPTTAMEMPNWSPLVAKERDWKCELPSVPVADVVDVDVCRCWEGCGKEGSVPNGALISRMLPSEARA